MTNGSIFSPDLRDLIVKALPEETSRYGTAPELRHTYLPTAHVKALHPDNMLVVGIRGSGKSFWWAALQQKEHRALLGERLNISETTIISTGFGERSSPDNYPGKDVLASLMEQYEAREIWQMVVVWHVGKSLLPEFASQEKWKDRVKWVKHHPEEVERCLFSVDNELESQDNYHLVLFDALDRTANDWKNMHALVRGLLQVLLDFRSYKRIRLKVFVRPDQIDDPSVFSFPDSSKIRSQRTELNWPLKELYGLFWQYLGNESNNGNIFRDGCVQLTSTEWKQKDGVWIVPEILRTDEETQRKVFHAMTGPWMGRDRRRGFPYTWLPNHLGDARRQVSPRSFLAALRHAATDRPREDQKYALHYESIKHGVQAASQIRVNEIQEDYPWVGELFEPLSGISVPCKFKEIQQKWEENGVLKGLEKEISATDIRLPPEHIKSGPEGVLKDLNTLGLVELMSDGRVNLPDVYRVGYRMGRRGGVKPMAR